MKKAKGKKPKQYTNDNLIESLGGILSGVGQQTADLGVVDSEEKQKIHAGDLEEGQELNLKDLKGENSPPGEEKAYIEPGIDYSREIVHTGERLANRENRENETQLRELMTEIKKLADSSRELQAQFKEIAVEQHVVKPGKYHKSFFAWMLSMVRVARMKVEDSGAWLAALQSKKKFREYGAMAKKHGTTFSLSNERVVATQVG